MDMDTSDSSTTNDEEGEYEIKYQYEIPYAIVYTTRLDEMNIFKDDPSRKCIDKIINSIIEESKPNFLKRKLPQTEFNYSCEDISFYLQKFNRKVARIAKKNNRLLSLCRPVRVVLEDIKYTSTQSRANNNSKISGLISAYNLSRKLNVKVIYDQQLKEADMYYLDINNLLQGYNKFRINDKFHALEVDNNMTVISCCCWYNRDAYLNTLVLNLNDAVRFMRKPHQCAVYCCVCCCRRKPILQLSDLISTSSSSLNPSEPPSKFLKKNDNLLLLLSLDKLRNSQKILLECSNSLTVVSKSKEKRDHHPVIEDALPFLHSTNIDFGTEYYVIGENGQIILHLRNYKRGQNLPSLVSTTANNIVGDICCWYKREEFATRLLELHALPNTVNYIRGVHTCSVTFCTCCCKPSNIEKTVMTLLPKLAMHTNDLVSRLVTFKVIISGVVNKPVIPDDTKHDIMPETTDPTEDTIYKMCSVKDTDKNANDIVSFNVSLSAMEMLTRGNNESFPLIITENDPNSVRVLVDTTGKRSAVIKCTRPLNNFTTKELQMLDVIFRAVNNLRQEHESKSKPSKREPQKKRGPQCTSAIYPLLLNTQMCISSDLRNKRFMPVLQAHLEKYKLPKIYHISTWLEDEQKKAFVKSKSDVKQKKL